jgi:alcohol dehydrogenase (NADP+)
MPIDGYMRMLKVGGTLVFVGVPEEALPPLQLTPLIMNNIFLGGSAIGSPAAISEMLELAATQKVKGWVETRPLKEANQAVIDMENGKARYRYCLVNEKNLAELKA